MKEHLSPNISQQKLIPAYNQPFALLCLMMNFIITWLILILGFLVEKEDCLRLLDTDTVTTSLPHPFVHISVEAFLIKY